MKTTALPPGPRGYLAPLALARYLAGGERILDQAFARYGDIFTISLPGFGNIVALADPKQIQKVLTSGSELIDATELNKVLVPVVGNLAVGVRYASAHRQLRKVMLPPLRGKHLEHYRELVTEAAHRTVDQLPMREPLRLLPVLNHALLEVILGITMGITDHERLARWVPPFTQFFSHGVSEQMTLRYMARKLGGLTSWPTFSQVRAECDDLIYREIARRRNTPDVDEGSTDMLGRLLVARTETGDFLTNVEIRDNLVNLIFAGHETSATALAWALLRTVHNPSVQHKLRAEATAGEADEYAGAVARESMRLAPPLGVIARKTVVPYRLGVHLLPVGTTIVIPLRVMHQDATIYPNPTEFNPDRFVDTKQSMYNYLVFGAGPHQCLGDHLAIMELKTFLHVFASRTTIEPLHRQIEPVRRTSAIYVPNHGCHVRLTDRRQRTCNTDRFAVPQTIG